MASLLKRILLSTSVLLAYATTANAAFNCVNPDPLDTFWTAPGPDDHIIEATPLTLGPVNPKNGGALWLMDSNGVRLEVCLDGDGTGVCFYDPPPPVVEDNPYSHRVGFGPEAFWWMAEAAIDEGDFSAMIVMAAEFAWISEDPAPNEQFLFTRLRFGLDGIPAAGTYYVTHPYGREIFVVTPDMYDADKEEFDRVFVSFDIELPSEGLGQGRIGPFLTSDTEDPDNPPPPLGHIGSLDGAQTVTGSPCDTNWFEVRGVAEDGITAIDLDGDINDGNDNYVYSTDKFALMGKYATRSGVNVTRATYTRGDWDPGMEVFANTFSDPDAEALGTAQISTLMVSAELSNGTNDTQTLVPGSVDPSGTLRSYTLLQPAYDGIDYAPQDVIITNVSDNVSNGNVPEDTAACILENACESSVRVPLVDMVNITEAYYNKLANEVEIAAWTTDDVSSCDNPGDAKLTAYADDGTYLGVLNVDPINPPGRHLAKALHFTLDANSPVATVPPRIIVKSCFGGSSDTSSMDIGLCERSGESQECTGSVDRDGITRTGEL